MNREREVYYSDQGRLLRCGYTTGSCATAAACAAFARQMDPDALLEEITIELPEGGSLEIPVLRAERLSESPGADGEVRPGVPAAAESVLRASVIKDAGDDADVTNGIEVAVTLRLEYGGSAGDAPKSAEDVVIAIEGGPGVGTVTKRGLQIPVGEPAINPVPRRMIETNLRALLSEHCFGEPPAQPTPRRITVAVEAVGGEEIARRTFNERLGIVGGISIIGTTGIVRPMSEDAFKASIHAELRQKREQGVTHLVLVPGKHGENYAAAEGFDADQIVHMSNFVGFALHSAVRLGFEHALIVGHIGKLVKLSAGVFNTHSKIADARAEVIAAQMALEGRPAEAIRRVFAANTTDEAAEMLRELGMLGVFESIARRGRERCLEHVRPQQTMGIDLVLYDMPGNKLGDTRTKNNGENL